MTDLGNLSEAIAMTLRESRDPDHVDSVMAECRTAITALKADVEKAEDRSLDPLIPAADVKASQASAAESRFSIARLDMALKRLGEQRDRLAAEFQNRARAKRFEEATTKRDALLAEIKAIYPAAAAKIGDLLAKVEEVDRLIVAVNQDRPEGAPPLKLPLRIAQEAETWGANAFAPLTAIVRLPALRSVTDDDFWGENRGRSRRRAAALAESEATRAAILNTPAEGLR